MFLVKDNRGRRIKIIINNSTCKMISKEGGGDIIVLRYFFSFLFSFFFLFFLFLCFFSFFFCVLMSDQ